MKINHIGILFLTIAICISNLSFAANSKGPVIVVSPENINIEVKQGFTNAAIISIYNPGDEDLSIFITAEYDSKSKSGGWISFNITDEIVKPGDTKDIEVTFSASNLELGDFIANIIIENNAEEDVFIETIMSVVFPAFNLTFIIKDTDEFTIDDAVISVEDIVNDAGNYVFEALVPGSYEYLIEKENHFSASGTVIISDDDKVLEITLISEITEVFNITFFIEDEFENPIENAYLEIEKLGSFLSNENGEISIIAFEYNYQYSVSKTGFYSFSNEIFIDEDLLIPVTMTYLKFNIDLTADPLNGGLVLGGREYYYGESATIIAEPGEFFNFLFWTINDAFLSDEEEFTFQVFEDLDITGHFELFRYNISAIANPEAGGEVSGSGEYFHGQPVTLIAIPSNGYSFIKWTENDYDILGAEAEYTFNAYEDRTLEAHFSLISYTLKFSVEDQDEVKIPDAIITLNSVNYEPGFYVFEDLVPDTYTYSVSKDGYFTVNGSVTITDSDIIIPIVIIKDNTGLAEFNYDISVYPNPAKDYFTVSCGEIISEIRLYNASGTEMQRTFPKSNMTIINISEFSSGLYFAKVFLGNNPIIIKIYKP
ncbi:MAG: T9SS type A sorting domain-containing protein [Bacteroidetes bacterium]|nr:T9SS type A sorting domain-containing protein [Bacteroidota bacterium]